MSLNYDYPFKQKWFRENLPAVLIIIGAALGFVIGFIIKNTLTLSPMAITYIGLPGKLLIRAFSMILVPLIICSLATSNYILKIKRSF